MATRLKLWKAEHCSETSMISIPRSQRTLMMRLAILTRYSKVTNRQTDRHFTP